MVICITQPYADEFAHVNSFGSYGDEDYQLVNPYGFDVHPTNGEIYIADTGHGAIKKFNRFGDYVNSLGSVGTADGEFKGPQDVALDVANSVLYVADTGNHRIQKFASTDYTHLLSFGTEGSGNGQLQLPRDIEVDTSGNLYVCDSENGRIVKFDSSGNWVANIGENDGLINPYGLDLDTSGNIYVADTYNHRILKYASDGTLLLQFGSEGIDSGEFTYPRDVAVSPTGELFVADTENYRIQRFDVTGSFINSYGAFVEFYSPQKVLASSDNKVYVIDSGTNKLTVYDTTSYITNVYADPTVFSPDGDGFVDTTSIHFTLPEPSKVSVTLYSAVGELVRVLAMDEYRVTDFNAYVWDGKNDSGNTVEAGDYSYRVDAVSNTNYHAPQKSGVVTVYYPAGQISGTITDGTNPLQGALVSDGIRADSSDANGDYAILNIPDGIYTITAIMDGCTDTSLLVAIRDGTTIGGLDFELDCSGTVGTGSISGTITDGTNPIVEATVSTGDVTAITGTDGSYLINELKADYYTVSVYKAGCDNDSAYVEVIDGEDLTNIDFALTCSADPDIRVAPTTLSFSEDTNQPYSVEGFSSAAVSMTSSVEQQAPEQQDFGIRLKSRQFIPEEDDDQLSAAISAAISKPLSDERVHRLVQLYRIPDSADKTSLSEAGVELISYIPNYAWLASVNVSRLASFTVHPLVRWAGELAATDKISPSIQAQGIANWGENVDGTVNLRIMFFADVSQQDAEELIAQQGGMVTKGNWDSKTLTVKVPRVGLNGLANEDIVQWIEDIPPPRKRFNDGAMSGAKINSLWSVPYELSGSGVTIGVWDGGHVDAAHDDFGGRVIYGDTAEVGEHATHVAGTLAGNGNLSEQNGGTANQWRGAAPDALILSYDWSDPIQESSAAIDTHGLDISQNSWGFWIDEGLYNNCSFYGDYLTDSKDYDALVKGDYGSPVNVVFSAGNERNDLDCNIQQNGGYGTIPPPGTGKNIITVGAVNSDDDSMTYFSSWGPVDDGRIKPDVVAPGCESGGEGYIHSTLPEDSYGNPGWCGTSMAAPVVSGSAALLIEQFASNYGADPLPSTIKALLTHTAEDLGTTGPDYQHGYGRIDATAAADVVANGAIIEATITADGQQDSYVIEVAGGATELKVTLAWDDEAAAPQSSSQLVNDLDLVLFDPASGTHLPWVMDPGNPSVAATTGVDSLNNVEQITIQNPPSGTWIIQVSGTTVPSLSQNYSLVSEHFSSGGPGDSQSETFTIYNDGVSDLVVSNISVSEAWLTVDTTSATVASNNSAVANVSVDSTGLSSGSYSGQILVTSNDPDEGQIIVTVTYQIAVVATDDTYGTDEDNVLSIAAPGVMANDLGANLIVSTVNGVANIGGFVELESGAIVTVGLDGSLTFDPNGVFDFIAEGQVEQDNFTYTIDDGISTDTATVSVTIDGINDAPVAADDFGTTAEDNAITLNLLANDSDIDGDILSVISLTQPANGTVVNNGSDVTYTPNANYNGSDNFSYTVSDGSVEGEPATVTITVTPVND
ncbi:MAG: S8 family serine peptidase, partial [Gammaproteobacteria bacterium]|nr:S8 family serine peptidase [Gammaproteobacteria bacterium]